MHGTEVQRLLIPVYRSLFTPTLALHLQKTHRHFAIIRCDSTPPQRREALGDEKSLRPDFLDHLTEALALPDRRGRWQFDIP